MARKYEVTAITGKYTDNSGQEKNRYQTIGAVIEGKNGLMLKLEAVPIGWDGWAYLNDPKPREGAAPAPAQRQQQQRQAPAPSGDAGFSDMDSEIPFIDPLKRRGLHLAI